MAVVDHPAYQEENRHLQDTLNLVEDTLETTYARKNVLDRNVAKAGRYHKSDSSQEFIDLLVNTQIQTGLALKLRNLEGARNKPYFARIDFHELGKPAKARLYLGKLCLTRDPDQELIIVDWRAPIANLYYEGRLGETSYQCPDGEIKGELTLKRQLSVEKGVLEALFDIDITTNDQFLQRYLGASAENRLKEIVATIQAEQNRIIRADLNRNLIIQGVAGSGKTTIALHRIAYLIYQHGRSFQPESFMIIAPNRLFLSYISEVLPELGVERVRQTTFEDFVQVVTGEKWQLKDPNQKLASFIENDPDAHDRKELVREASAFKGSLRFREVIDRYLQEVEAKMLPEGDFTFEDDLLGGSVVLTWKEIGELFFRDYRDWPIYRRLEQLKKHFAWRVEEFHREMAVRLQDECNKTVERLKMSTDQEGARERIIAAIDHKNDCLKRLKRFVDSGITKYMQRITLKPVLRHYKEFLTGNSGLIKLATGMISPELIRFIREETSAHLREGYLEVEDLAPVLYLKHRLYGLDERYKLKHLVLDEAQDFSLFQYETLRRLFKDGTFTILGDLAQGIHAYRSLRTWDELRDQVFAGGADRLNLIQSYRTTVEIMEAANQVLSRWKSDEIIRAEPVIRHGAPVKIQAVPNREKLLEMVLGEVERFQGEGRRSVAVIGKTARECQELFDVLAEKENVQLITGKETEYRGGVSVIPVHLAKGLEFDAVIIADASREKYREEELEIKLLYIAMTRALHRLTIFHTGEISSNLAGLSASA